MSIQLVACQQTNNQKRAEKATTNTCLWAFYVSSVQYSRSCHLYHYLTSWYNCPQAFSQATFNCLCLSLSHRHNPVWCFFFSRDGVLTLRVGLTQSEIFTPRPSIWAKIFNYPSPFLKLVSCIDYFLLIAAQTFHTSSKQARLDMQQFKILSAVILIKQQLQPFTCRTHSNNTYKS